MIAACLKSITTMELDKIFDQVSIKMRADLASARASLTHPGMKGDAIEECVRIFLRQYLPKTLDISSGILVDSDGRQSRQLDIVVSDAAKTPVFFQSEKVRVIPAECAYAIVEVKSSLDQLELEKAYQNMQSVKSLSKRAYFDELGAIRHTHTLYGKEWNNWPTHHFVFAFDSISLATLKDNLDELQKNQLVWERIDSIYVLEKGVIVNVARDGFSALPSQGSLTVVSLTNKPLLFFYTLLSMILNQAAMKNFNIQPYLGKIRF
jgi:hypothetical protein